MTVARWALFASLAGIVLLLLVGALRLLIFPGSTTYSVETETDRLRFESVDAPPSMLFMENVEVLTPDASSGMVFTGFIELASQVEVQIDRVGMGPLHIGIRKLRNDEGLESPEDANPGSVGRLLSLSEEVVLDAGTRLDIFADSMLERSRAGNTFLIPISGNVTSGREVMMETNRSTSVLRSGVVSLLAGTVFGAGSFEARSVRLGLGDRFVIERPLGSSVGLVHIDESPSLSAAYRVVGSDGRIDRAGGSTFMLNVSWFDRVVNDPIFGALSFILGLFAALSTIVMLNFSWFPTNREGDAAVADEPNLTAGGDDDQVTEAPAEGADGPKTGPEGSKAAPSFVLLLCIALLSTTMAPATGHAQESVFIDAGEEGQGLLRARLNSCFVITPRHVVENSAGGVTVVGAQGLRSSGQIEILYDVDLALIRLEQAGEIQCGTWRDLPALGPLLRSGTGYLVERGAAGGESRTAVNIGRVDEDYVTVVPQEGRIRQSMSGSALVIDGVPVGLLLSVCPENPAPDLYCTPDEGDVLRLDAVRRHTDGFFQVQVTDAAAQRIRDAEFRQRMAQIDSLALARADSATRAARNGRPADLPNLLRDFGDLSLYPLMQAEYLPPEPGRFGQGHLEYYAGVERGEKRTLLASMLLSPPVQRTAPPLPREIAECSLNGDRGEVRSFRIGEPVSEGAMGTVFRAVAWEYDGEELPVGEYWLECTVDGEIFESQRLQLEQPIRPWGEFAFPYGEQALGRVDEVRLSGPGAEASWTIDPVDAPETIQLPVSRRPDARYQIEFDVRQTSGDPVPYGTERTITCSVQGALGKAEMTDIATVAPDHWHVTQSFAPGGGRIRSGDEAHVLCGWQAGAAFFQVVIEFT